MVRTCSMGRKWALRACGRALFGDIGRRVAAGVADFKGSEAVSNWDAWRASLGGATGHSREFFSTMVGVKASYFGSAASLTNATAIDPCFFFYICCLAESRGFNLIVGKMEIVWKRDVLFFCEDPLKIVWRSFFYKLQSYDTPSLEFQPFQSFAGEDFFSGPLRCEMWYAHMHGVFDVSAEFKLGLLTTIFEILPAEVVCLILLVSVLDDVNTSGQVFACEEAAEKLSKGLGPLLKEIFSGFVIRCHAA